MSLLDRLDGGDGMGGSLGTGERTVKVPGYREDVVIGAH